MDSLGEKRTVTFQRNPLLISTVIKCVFEYLPVKDLKQCSVVCDEWNSVSRQILKKQSRIYLNSKERIANFLEFFKSSDTRDFPFTSFRLYLSDTEWNTEEYDQLIDLFFTLREKITALSFEDFRKRGIFHDYFIEIATNLVSLTLSSRYSCISLNKVEKVKYLSLSQCHVSLDAFENRIAPLSIHLMNVTFEQNKKKLHEILINDYIDFSRCSKIDICARRKSVMIFDMSRDIVSARKVYFDHLRVINSRLTSTKLDERILSHEKNTGIKQFISSYCDCPELNLSVLPKSLEKVTLYMNTYGTINSMPIALPNLKFLFFGPAVNDINVNLEPTVYDMDVIISKFRLCPKLVDMELMGICFFVYPEYRVDIDVDLLPVTLKRIKLSQNKKMKLVGDTVIHVDSLVLDTGSFADAQKFMNKIKPKIIVVHLQYHEVEDPAGEIVSFVEASRSLDKIVLSVPEGGLVGSSYKRTLSRYVDGDDTGSTCYEFANQVGKRIPQEEFDLHYWFQFSN